MRITSRVVERRQEGREVRTVAPESWPGAAASGHVYGVHNNEASGVGLGCGDAYALASRGDLWSRFDSHDNIPRIVDVDQTGGLLQGKF